MAQWFSGSRPARRKTQDDLHVAGRRHACAREKPEGAARDQGAWAGRAPRPGADPVDDVPHQRNWSELHLGAVAPRSGLTTALQMRLLPIPSIACHFAMFANRSR
jgi:hypothetical protein